MTDLIYAYDYSEETRTHTWSLKGPLGGVHIWAAEAPPGFTLYRERHYGGIEIHSPKQLYGFKEGPSHENCWLIGQPCWHDGSSLQFSEWIAPMLEREAPFPEAIHEYIRAELASRYKYQFEENDE